MNIPFNKAFKAGKEFTYIENAISKGGISGDQIYTQKCHAFFEKKLNAKRVLLTHSCTAALEMAAILGDFEKGDEIIMPSYTFVSTANAFVLRGGVPVFVDIKPDTLNIDERLIEAAITPRTKAICVVHYAGLSCEMDRIMAIARNHGLLVIEDAAQGVGSFYKGRPLGTIGDIGCFSFHETKNIISGEGGAIVINNPDFIKRAEIIREKGTNRSQFFRGEIDKYTWVDIGSSFLPSDMVAAYLYAQLENMDSINRRRIEIWNQYHRRLEKYEGKIKRPKIFDGLEHNAHMYYVLFENLTERTNFINFMKNRKINPVFHYIPLHSSPAGKIYGRTHGSMGVTDRVSDTLVRLPLFYTLKQEEIDFITEGISDFFNT